MPLFDDQIKKAMFISGAVAVVPNDNANLPRPGVMFLDEASTEGNAKVDLFDGGTITLALKKGDAQPFLVKKVYATGTTALGIFVNPVE